MKVGANIRTLRKKHGLDQAELAARVGITQPYLSQLENGKRDPSISLLRKVVDELHISLPGLFLMSMDENDVQPDRRDAFEELRPHLERFLLEHATENASGDRTASDRVASE